MNRNPEVRFDFLPADKSRIATLGTDVILANVLLAVVPRLLASLQDQADDAALETGCDPTVPPVISLSQADVEPQRIRRLRIVEGNYGALELTYSEGGERHGPGRGKPLPGEPDPQATDQVMRPGATRESAGPPRH